MANHGGAYVTPGAGSSMTRKPGSSPVYQIDFTAVASGKRIASTKRRIRWRFGFTNQDALASGETGTACRGEEHDITVVWSITSGKRLVLADGQEVHYSNSRSSVLEFSWTMRGNHVMKIICHASPPINVQPGFRQYDFYVDGQSFFNMPKVYRLGINGGSAGVGSSAVVTADSGALALATSSRRTTEYNNYTTPVTNSSATDITSLETPHNVDEEQAYLAEAIKNSLQEDKAVPAPAPKPAEDNLLLDFFSEPAPAAAPVTTPAPAQPDFATPAAPPTHNDITNQFAALQPAAQAPAVAAGYGYNQSAPVSNPFSPAPATADPGFGAPVPVSLAEPQIQAPVTAQPAPTYGALPVGSPAPVPAPAPVEAPSAAIPPQTPTPDVSNVFAPAQKGLGTDANAAYENFAKMDSFKLTSANDDKRSNPFDAAPLSAPAPTLAGMKSMNASSSLTSEKKPVMSAPPPGAMVVAAGVQQQGNWGGYGAQLGGSMTQQPAMGMYGQQPAYGMQQPVYGAPAPTIGGYGMQGVQQPMYQQPQGQYGQYPPQQQQQPPPLNGQYYGQQF